MNTNIFYKISCLVIVLFIFSISFSAIAQDTITWNDPKYYWNNEPANSDEARIAVQYLHSSWISLKPEKRTQKTPVIIKRIILPPNTERIIYGIAGTTVACTNPDGCYFYLCRRVNNNSDSCLLEIVDSVEWGNNSFSSYIDYDMDTLLAGRSGSLPSAYQIFDSLAFPNGDSTSIVPIYEAYFSSPRSIADTFYIGMNSNMFEENNTKVYRDILGIFRKYFPLIYNADDWLYADFYNPYASNNTIYASCSGIGNLQTFHGMLFPILEPATDICPDVNNIWVENVDTNSAVIEWVRPYIATYYNVEYGVEGFARGIGTVVNNIDENNTTMMLSDLLPNTNYEFYIQAYCSVNDTLSNWRRFVFRTLNPYDFRCAEVENLDTMYVRDVRAKIQWQIAHSNVEYCQIEFGESGFEQGTGTLIRYVYDSSYFFNNLTPGTSYDAYVRSYCPTLEEYSPWQMITFTAKSIGINEAKPEIPITLQPNPTEGIVEVSLPQEYENHPVELYDLQGKLLQTNTLQAGKTLFNLSSYPNGVYVIKVGETSKQVVKGKY